MRTNPAGQALLRSFEGCELTPYQDSAGFWTCGIGHVIHEPDEHGLMAGITPEEAESLFRTDLAKAERAVERWTDVALTSNQFSALVAWVFNLGEGRYRDSTLRQLVNQKKFAAASGQFGRWVYAGGKPNKGLIRRREAEMDLFNTADTAGMDV